MESGGMGKARLQLPKMSGGSELFTPEDLRRIEAETFVGSVEFYRELASTNDLALELACHDGVELPFLVLAQMQTAGRGRGSNRWWAIPGALTFSLVIDTAALALSKDRWPQVSLTAGLAVCEAAEKLHAKLDCGIKWPNDVFIGWRKVSGILVEIPQACAGRLVVGVGVNVNNSLTAAPAEVQSIATSLYDETQQHFDLASVLVGILRRFESRLDSLVSGGSELSDAWRQRSILQGRAIELDVGSKRVRGTCSGIDTDGALLLQTGAGSQRFYAGVVAAID